MIRRAPLVVAGTVLALPGEKGGPVYLRVEEEGGALSEGRGRWKKDGLELEPLGKPARKIPFRRIASIEEIDIDAPPPAFEREKDRADWLDRKKALDERAGVEPRKAADDWVHLGWWAHRRGLEDEALEAYRKAVELQPEDAGIRQMLGETKAADGTWKPAASVLAEKRSKVGSKPSDLLELAQFAAKFRLDFDAIDIVFPLSQKNAYDKSVLSFLRPVTDRRKPKTQLSFPLRGRWKISADPTHHHELKTFAVYAIDLYKDVEGKHYKGTGRELEDHYAFGEPIYACADGRVVEVREGFPDNPINQLEGKQEKHNGVYVLHENNEATWYLHTMKGTITVKNGDKVTRGQLLAKVGNSGGSSIPHLHFTLVDARHAVSVPWQACNYWLLTEDGARIRVKQGRPVEGQLIEVDEDSAPPKTESPQPPSGTGSGGG